MTSVSLRLPDEIGARLNRLAEETGRSKTFYMIEAIQEHLCDLEDAYLAKSRSAEIKAGKAQTVTYEEVRKNLGLED